jgi:hypothetical protein
MKDDLAEESALAELHLAGYRGFFGSTLTMDSAVFEQLDSA